MIRMKDRRRATRLSSIDRGRHTVGPLLHGRGGRPACRRCPGGRHLERCAGRSYGGARPSSV